MVREVVIDSGASLAVLFLRIAEVAGVSVLVVRPQESHVFRYFKTMMICIEHFFVCTQHLRDFLHRCVYVAADYVALVVEGLLHEGCPFLGRTCSLHRIVVDSAEAEGVDVFISSVGPDPFFPVVNHRLTVGDVVEISVCTYILPLVFIVSEHLLAVRCTHYDRIIVCKTGVFRVTVECLCTVVHCRPEEVAFQTQQQFEHLLICLRTHLAAFLVECLFSPA